MKLANTLSHVALAALLAAPIAASAQEAYGEKGWVDEVGSKSYVPERSYRAAPKQERHVYVKRTQYVDTSTYGCVMGLGVMQRGTLICPGH